MPVSSTHTSLFCFSSVGCFDSSGPQASARGGEEGTFKVRRDTVARQSRARRVRPPPPPSTMATSTEADRNMQGLLLPALGRWDGFNPSVRPALCGGPVSHHHWSALRSRPLRRCDFTCAVLHRTCGESATPTRDPLKCSFAIQTRIPLGFKQSGRYRPGGSVCTSCVCVCVCVLSWTRIWIWLHPNHCAISSPT